MDPTSFDDSEPAAERLKVDTLYPPLNYSTSGHSFRGHFCVLMLHNLLLRSYLSSVFEPPWGHWYYAFDLSHILWCILPQWAHTPSSLKSNLSQALLSERHGFLSWVSANNPSICHCLLAMDMDSDPPTRVTGDLCKEKRKDVMVPHSILIPSVFVMSCLKCRHQADSWFKKWLMKTRQGDDDKPRVVHFDRMLCTFKFELHSEE